MVKEAIRLLFTLSCFAVLSLHSFGQATRDVFIIDDVIDQRGARSLDRVCTDFGVPYEDSWLDESVNLRDSCGINGQDFKVEEYPGYPAEYGTSFTGLEIIEGFLNQASCWELDIEPVSLGMSYAWEQELTGSEDMVIALIDDGINYTHYGYGDQVWVNEDEIYGNGIDDDDNGYVDDRYGYDVYYDTADSILLNGISSDIHADILSTIIASQHNDRGPKSPFSGNYVEGDSILDAVNQPGICPDCKLMNVKVWGSDDESRFLAPTAEEGIYYAVDNGAKIIVLALASAGASYRTDPFLVRDLEEILTVRIDSAWDAAIEYAWDNGVLVIGGSGNNNPFLRVPDSGPVKGQYNILTNHPAVLQITGYANSWNSQYDNFAAEGSSVDLIMPMLARVSASGYKSIGGFAGGQAIVGGTSYATAYAAGLIGLYWSYNPQLSAYEVKKHVLETALDRMNDYPQIDNLYANRHCGELRLVPNDTTSYISNALIKLVYDTAGFDPYYGYGYQTVENLFTGPANKTVEIDPVTGSVNGYQKPRFIALEDMNTEFIKRYNDIGFDFYGQFEEKIITSIPKDEMGLYPVPASDHLNVGDNQNKEYVIFNHAGVILMRGKLNGSPIDLSSLSNGSYIISFKQNNSLWTTNHFRKGS